MPKWLVKLLAGIVPGDVRPVLQAIVAGWGTEAAFKGAALGLAKLSRHMASRAKEIAEKTGATAPDNALYAAQAFLDQAASEFKKAAELL